LNPINVLRVIKEEEKKEGERSMGQGVVLKGKAGRMDYFLFGAKGVFRWNRRGKGGGRKASVFADRRVEKGKRRERRGNSAGACGE